MRRAGIITAAVYLPLVAVCSVKLAAFYGVVSALLFCLYGFDKAAAMSNGKGGRKHRIAEKSLHVVALAGGWPGAQLGRLVFRHKTVKASFIHRFWLMAALNVAITFGMLYYNR